MTDDLVRRGRYACNMGLSNADLFRLASDMADRIEALTAERDNYKLCALHSGDVVEAAEAEIERLRASMYRPGPQNGGKAND
jgi:hypothetical protein